ncbi:signal peptidase complex subunit 2, partial [Paragonimus heterotremus]
APTSQCANRGRLAQDRKASGVPAEFHVKSRELSGTCRCCLTALNLNCVSDGDVRQQSALLEMATTSDEDVVVNRWNATAVKNALDDATKKYNLVESHYLFDGRLFLCTISVLIAGFALAWDFFYPHPQSRTVLIVCVISYFILSGIISIYVLYVEKNIFYVAKRPDPTGVDPPDVWQLSSHMNKYDPTYNLSLVVIDGENKKSKSASLKRMDLYNPVAIKLFADLQSGKKDQ